MDDSRSAVIPGAVHRRHDWAQLTIDERAERGHRGIAIGRKNWRMVGSQRGGHSAAIHFSFISSCKMNCVEPFGYLVDVLQRLPHPPRAELGELLPHRWKPRPAV